MSDPVGHHGHTQQSMKPSGHEPMGGGQPSRQIGEGLLTVVLPFKHA